MDATQSSSLTPNQPQPARVFAVGTAGLNVAAAIDAGTLLPEALVAVHADQVALNQSRAAHRILLESKSLLGLGLGGDPLRGRAAAEEQLARIKELCAGVPVVVIIAALGGAAGTGASPVIARTAREAGAHVVVFTILPFDCEGSMRLDFAADGLRQLRNLAHLVVDLPNQKAAARLDAAASLVQTFSATNRLLADCVQGVITSLNTHCVMGLPFVELSRVTRLRSSRCAFALVEVSGENRAQVAVENILKHHMLEQGQILRDAQSVAVSIVGGSSLSMLEVNAIMEQVNRACRDIPVMMGACIANREPDSLRLGFLVALTNDDAAPAGAPESCETSGAGEELPEHLLNPKDSPRPSSRFVPPAPDASPEKISAIRHSGTKVRKSGPKLRQAQLQLEIISKGRFDKSEPTIHKGEDLDVPTYIRRGVLLN